MPQTLFVGHSFYSRLQMALECLFAEFGPVVLARGGALLDSFDVDLHDLSRLEPGRIFICLLDNEIFTRSGWRRHKNLNVILQRLRILVLRLKYQFPMAQIFVDLCHCRLEPGFGQTVFQEQYMDLAHNLNSMVLDLSYDMGFYVLGSGLTVWPEPKVKYTKKYLNTSLLSSDGIHPSEAGMLDLMASLQANMVD